MVNTEIFQKPTTDLIGWKIIERHTNTNFVDCLQVIKHDPLFVKVHKDFVFCSVQ